MIIQEEKGAIMSNKNTYQFNNLTKAQQDCLALIDTLGIYELRALARVFGDNSPTTLKRNDHISIIMNKIIAGDDLKPIPLRQGRPYKELSNIEGILAELSQITGKEYSLNAVSTRSASSPKTVTFRQMEENIIKQKLNPVEIKGVLWDRNDKEFYIHTPDDKLVLVRKDVDSRLKVYDYVVGTAIMMNNNNEYILDSISSINYQDAKSYTDNFEPYAKDIIPTQKLDFEGKQILLGSRYAVKISNFIEDLDKTKNLVKCLKNQGIITVGIIPNVMPEQELTVQEIGFDKVFSISYNRKATLVNEIFSLFMHHIDRLQQLGKNIAIFVEDVVTLTNAIDYTFKNNPKSLMGHTEIAVETVKKLMMLAKASADGKSTTLFVTFDQPDMFDQMYISSVYKVSKKIDL